MSDKDGGPAFPSSYMKGGRGMSMRDWFAGQALQGLVSRISNEDFNDIRHGIRAGGHEAHVAYTLADAMLARKEGED